MSKLHQHKNFIAWTFLCLAIVFVTYIAATNDMQHPDLNIKTAYYILAGALVVIIRVPLELYSSVNFKTLDALMLPLFAIQWLTIWYVGWRIHKKHENFIGFYILLVFFCWGIFVAIQVLR